MQPTGSITPSPVARVIALVAAVAVFTRHLRAVEGGLVCNQKTHQKADNGNEHEGVEYKTRRRGQTISTCDPASKNATHGLVRSWTGNCHVGHKWDQVVETHLILSNILLTPEGVKVGWVHLGTLDSTSTVGNVLAGTNVNADGRVHAPHVARLLLAPDQAP
jgi:hypothetical protein